MQINIANSIIEPKDIMKLIVPLYNFKYHEIECILLKHCKNDTYKIILDKTKYFIEKIYSHYNNVEKIKQTIETLSLIKKHAQNISYAIPKKNGEYVSILKFPEGNRYITLHNYAPGVEQKYKTEVESYRYGIFIATLHQNIDISLENYTNFDQNIIKKDFIHSVEIINHYLLSKNRFSNIQYIKNLSKLILNKLNDFQLEIAYCHNDLHGGNAHLLGDQLMFFDFDFSNFYPRAYELAVFKWSCEIGKRYKHWKIFLDAYTSIKPLNDCDKQAINFFILIRDIIIMSLDIDKTKLYGEIYLNDDYINKRIHFFKKMQKKYNIFN